MRYGAPTDLSALASDDYQVYARLVIGSTPIPDSRLSDLLGYDPLLTVTISAEIDQPTASGTLTLHLGLNEQSLSPLVSVGANYAGSLIYPGKYFTIYTAIDTGGFPPINYTPVMVGRFDSVDPAGADDTLVCTWRDPGCDLQDLMLEGGFTVGGGDLKDVMQGLIDAGFAYNTSLLPYYQLQALGDTAWTVNPYWQEEGSLGEALRRLAIQIGWDVRYRFDTGGGLDVMAPTLYLPDRVLANAAVYDLGAKHILSVRRLNISRDGVRNIVSVWYGGSARLEAATSDPESQARYGRRFMRLAEDLTSNIDTSDEAVRLRDAALADLKDPIAEAEVELRYWWPVELNDVYTFPSNGVIWDQPQTLAVTGYTHTLENGGGTTVLRVRGRPLAAHDFYRRGQPRMQHVYLEPPPDDAIPAEEGARWAVVDSLDLP